MELPLHFIAPEGPDARQGIPLILYRPASLPARAPVLVCVHGYTRQPLDHLQAFAPVASAAGFAVALPLFRDSGPHRKYQQLLHPRQGTRSDLALLEGIERLEKAHDLDVERLHFFGFSGGAQFAHRLAMLHPHRVASVGVGAAGWYTWPDHDHPWPGGLAGAPRSNPDAARFEGFLRLPIALWVGERDTEADAHLRNDPTVNALQGFNRLERAQRWAAAVRTAAVRRNIPARVRMELLPRAGHDFLACHRKARLADRVVAHAAQAVPAVA
jgi:pimeloyl-ACP methyl ester carboxylesterase